MVLKLYEDASSSYWNYMKMHLAQREASQKPSVMGWSIG